jgi:hypothetical protein
MKFLGLALLLMSVGSCSTRPSISGPIEEFRRQNPVEFKQFSYLNPISLDTYRAVVGDRFGVTSYILNEVDRRFGTNADISAFVAKMEDQQGKDRQIIIDDYRALEQLSSGGGIVCQYEWSDNHTKEIGFLVLKSGAIVRRVALVTDYLKESKPVDEPIEVWDDTDANFIR